MRVGADGAKKICFIIEFKGEAAKYDNNLA